MNGKTIAGINTGAQRRLVLAGTSTAEWAGGHLVKGATGVLAANLAQLALNLVEQSASEYSHGDETGD